MIRYDTLAGTSNDETPMTVEEASAQLEIAGYTGENFNPFKMKEKEMWALGAKGLRDLEALELAMLLKIQKKRAERLNPAITRVAEDHPVIEETPWFSMSQVSA